MLEFGRAQVRMMLIVGRRALVGVSSWGTGYVIRRSGEGPSRRIAMTRAVQTIGLAIAALTLPAIIMADVAYSPPGFDLLGAAVVLSVLAWIVWDETWRALQGRWLKRRGE
jgi:hypothetical protein